MKLQILLIALILVSPVVGIINNLNAKEERAVETTLEIKEIKEVDANNYCILQLENALYMHQEGYPMLPYYVKTYTYPAGTKINGM
ncbi:MAG: hypothetical protein J7L80_01330, partial [Thermoplasmata archaeon]|nr:hypothetical protein [Thermoplasmata archaeon]